MAGTAVGGVHGHYHPPLVSQFAECATFNRFIKSLGREEDQRPVEPSAVSLKTAGQCGKKAWEGCLHFSLDQKDSISFSFFFS